MGNQTWEIANMPIIARFALFIFEHKYNNT